MSAVAADDPTSGDLLFLAIGEAEFSKNAVGLLGEGDEFCLALSLNAEGLHGLVQDGFCLALGNEEQIRVAAGDLVKGEVEDLLAFAEHFGVGELAALGYGLFSDAVALKLLKRPSLDDERLGVERGVA